MSRYNSEEHNSDLEFKIVRSTMNHFRKPETFTQLVEEEAISGWELLEKLDDGRVRFKRHINQRKRDPMLPAGIDPYRTQYGISEGSLGLFITLGIFIVMGIVGGIIALVESGAFHF
ncbi:MAG: hypothetical protein HC806_01995 [Anaerolineae bacterium]|nr:hypothetical protein [Anaerolineae bacterium]